MTYKWKYLKYGLISILVILLAFLLGTSILSMSKKHNETEKWGYYVNDKRDKVTVTELLNTDGLIELNVGYGTSKYDCTLLMNNEAELLELLNGQVFHSYRKKTFEKDIDEPLTNPYKTFCFSNNKTEFSDKEWMRVVIRLENNSVFIVYQYAYRFFSVYKSEDTELYTRLEDYFDSVYTVQ